MDETSLPDEPMPIIVRVAPEVMLKANSTRRRFLDILQSTLTQALEREGIVATQQRLPGRLVLLTSQREAAIEVLPRVFGIASYSPVEARVAGGLDDIARVAVELFAPRLHGRSFAVRAKRMGVQGLSSPEVERFIGAALHPFARVDLTRPDVTVRVDLHPGCAYLYSERLPGAGGLPMSTQGRAMALMSGGFDSAVAAWYVMKRGADLDFVFCNLAGVAHQRMVLRVAHALVERWGAGMRPRFITVNFGPLLDEIKAKTSQDLWQIMLKRCMYRAACRLAQWRRGEALVTGEALGQVSSQTLSNLNTIDEAADLPVFRPLIGFDKQAIVDAARRIGTAHMSEHIQEYCAITPRHPAVRSSRGRVSEQEARLDPMVLETALRDAQSLDLAALEPDDLDLPYVFVDTLPEGAVLIDLQPEAMFRAWHVPGALHQAPEVLPATLRSLAKDRTYVLYCPHGTRSVFLAELMQEAGFDAYAFRGGVEALRRKAGPC